MPQQLYVGGYKFKGLKFLILLVLVTFTSIKVRASETVVHATLFSSAKVESVIAILKQNKAVQAKQVEFGRKLRGVPYFHFKLSNDSWLKLESELNQLGSLVQTRRETPGSGVRVIMWLKDLDYNQLFVFQNTTSEEAVSKLTPSEDLFSLLQAQLSKGQITIYENANWKSGMGIYHRRIPTKLSQFDQSAQLSIQEKNKCQFEILLKEQNLALQSSVVRVPKKQVKDLIESVVKLATVTLGVKSLDQDLVFRVDPKSLNFTNCNLASAEKTSETATPVLDAKAKAPAVVLKYEHELNFYTYLDQPELRFTTENGDCELESQGVKSEKLADHSRLRFDLSNGNSPKEILVKCLDRVDQVQIEKKDAKDLEFRLSGAVRKSAAGNQIATFQELKYKQKLERAFDVNADSDLFQKRQIGLYVLATQNASDAGSITTAELVYGRFTQNWYYGLAAQTVYAASFDSVLVGGAFVEYNLELPTFDSFLLNGRKSLLASGRYYPAAVVNINNANNLYIEFGGKLQWNSSTYLTMSLQNQKLDYSSSSSTRNSSVDVTITSAFMGLGFQF